MNDGIRQEWVDIEGIEFAPVNPKLHDLGVLAESETRYGFVELPIANLNTGRLVVGQGRIESLRALKRNGQTPPVGVRVEEGRWFVEVRLFPFKDEDAAAAYLIDSNNIGLAGGGLSALTIAAEVWDTDAYTQMLGALAQHHALPASLDGDDYDALVEQRTAAAVEEASQVAETAAALQTKWDVRRGDEWICGRHRLFCLNALDPKTAARVRGDGEVNMIADPPYNVGFNYDLTYDRMICSDYQFFCERWFELWQAAATVITPGPRNERLYPEPKDRGVWIKRNATAGASVFYYRTAEPILFYGDFAQKRNTDVFDYSSGFADELSEAHSHAGVREKHPPGKPLELWKELIGMFGAGVVCDPFLGNGTSLLACEMLSRELRGVEISPAYIAVALERWSRLTGGSPQKK